MDCVCIAVRNETFIGFFLFLRCYQRLQHWFENLFSKKKARFGFGTRIRIRFRGPNLTNPNPNLTAIPWFTLLSSARNVKTKD